MKSLFLALSLFTSLLAQPCLAEEAPPLAGTTWEGEFRSTGMSGRIRLAFLNEPNGGGALQYFSKPVFDGFPFPLDRILTSLDKTCEFTPRAVGIDENGGEIRVYECAPSLEQETELAEEPARPAKLSLNVRRLTIDESGQNLTITVVKGPIRVKYRLVRTNASESARTREELKAWADHFNNLD
jgi:hypothetical protein